MTGPANFTTEARATDRETRTTCLARHGPTDSDKLATPVRSERNSANNMKSEKQLIRIANSTLPQDRVDFRGRVEIVYDSSTDITVNDIIEDNVTFGIIPCHGVNAGGPQELQVLIRLQHFEGKNPAHGHVYDLKGSVVGYRDRYTPHLSCSSAVMFQYQPTNTTTCAGSLNINAVGTITSVREKATRGASGEVSYKLTVRHECNHNILSIVYIVPRPALQLPFSLERYEGCRVWLLGIVNGVDELECMVVVNGEFKLESNSTTVQRGLAAQSCAKVAIKLSKAFDQRLTATPTPTKSNRVAIVLFVLVAVVSLVQAPHTAAPCIFTGLQGDSPTPYKLQQSCRDQGDPGSS
ncbi:hypothetical protein, variant [Puccinia triticina 1-1 BBBD Race 1]|uniref:Uncharacterized protein n=1 Tax=Puccinia triticina (isolate 1-1 / race 1 (BBBD)) TaxID=630390 RepID=A0A180GR12_PUCT1|nr:hypothetical protein, variant [Puccinia triticina 1-1 BBBD Race 1]